MLIGAADLELEVRHGVTAEEIIAFARSHGAQLPDSPWCGTVRIEPRHPAGRSPLVAHSRLTSSPGPDARPRPGVHLAVVGGPDSGMVATLADGLVAGRDSAAGLRLTDPTVSARHALFAGGRVRAISARNGALVRGRRLRWRSRIGAGDVIRLGDTTVVVCDPAAHEQPEPARTRPWGLASSAMAALSMGVIAIAMGHPILALAALALPAATAAAYLARRPRRSVGPVLDVTGTMTLAPLPPGPIAVHGPRGLIRAVTVATGRPPATAPHAEEWMRVLPAAQREVTWVRDGGHAPSWAEVTISAQGDAVVVAGHGETVTGPLPLMTEQNAGAAARRIAARASGTAVPGSVRWGELPKPPSGGLPVRLGVGAGGPIVLDLVADGPHVLVAGTTGSGKSEALRTIVCSLAHDFAPSDVSFALIDFKGGAGLRECAALPHVGSVLTDLEPHLARRCLLALAAELADRKRAAAAAGATGFDDWQRGRPPRLVVVVDEFQEIAASDRDFLPELARLAAQGRSLGIHLVLATQRPAGAVGAQIRANISATLALRTASEAESRDLIGSPAAALIPQHLPGRALLLRGTALEEVQVALPLVAPLAPVRVAGEPDPPGDALVDVASERHHGSASPLWLPELPSRIAPLSAMPGDGSFALGVADVPRNRLRGRVGWDPAAGPLVITGPPRSGRSTALAAVAALACAQGKRPVFVPRDPRLAVRTLALAASTPNAVLLVDDCAQTLAAANTADAEAADLLAEALLRVPTALVVPPAWSSHRLTAHASLRIALCGLADADDAGWSVPSDLRGLAAAPGRCRVADADGWREAQLALPGAATARPLALPLPAAVAGSLPRNAIGIGGDECVSVAVPPSLGAVVGHASAERDAVVTRLAFATGTEPIVTESAFTLGVPGSPAPRIIVAVRPTARGLRELMREHPRGLVEPTHSPFRAVVVIDGAAQAVQVLPG